MPDLIGPDPGDPAGAGPGRRPRRRVVLVAGVLLLAAVASGMALYRGRGDGPTTPLTVVWGGSEGHPCCVYDAKNQTVVAELEIEGTAIRRHTVTVTVTAYADENTSVPVGSTTRSVRVDGTMHRSLVITIPVSAAAHVDEDGVAACRLSVKP